MTQRNVKVLVGVDGSEGAKNALVRTAKWLKPDDKVVLVFVHEALLLSSGIDGEALLRKSKKKLLKQVVRNRCSMIPPPPK